MTLLHKSFLNLILSVRVINFSLGFTHNEIYNLPPYILAVSMDNKSKASTSFSFIQRVNSCQKFILNGSLLLE